MSDENTLVSSDLPKGEQIAEPDKISDKGTEESQAGEKALATNDGENTEAETSEKESDGEGDKEGDKDAKLKTPWYERRLRQQSAKIAEMARINEIQAQLLESINANTQQQDDESPTPKQAPNLTEAQIEAKAREIVEIQSFNAACNVAHEQGLKQFGEAFSKSVQTLQAIGVMEKSFLQAAIDTEKPAAVIHYLGQNPEEMERISALSPTKMAIALDRIAAKSGSKSSAPVSKVPAPVRPVSGKTVSNGDPEKMSMQDWLKWREDQLAKKTQRR